MSRVLFRSFGSGAACVAVSVSALLISAIGCGSDPSPAGTTTSTSTSTGPGGGGTGGVGEGGGGAGGNGGQGGMGQGGAGGGVLVTTTYSNPISAAIPGGGVVEHCPDPAVIYGQKPGQEGWYVYCTSDPLNDNDKNGAGDYNTHLIPVLTSKDLVEWTYAGDALSGLPSYALPNANLWAPDIQFWNGTYYLYFMVTEAGTGGSAIGVATSDSPTGPWKAADKPVVEPHAAPCCAGSKRWTYDPSVIADENGQRYIYYGSFFGGLSVRKLSDDGLTSDPSTQIEVTIPNRYEGAYVTKREGYYYLFGSASSCCNGPLSGYSVFVGRSTSPLGPFIDREGQPMLAARVGGTPVLSQNGNRWVGPGHNALLTDFGGQDWILYHAIDDDAPYFEQGNGGLLDKRHLMMDALDWIDGWPTVRGGAGPSDTPQPAPAAQPGQVSGYMVKPVKDEKPGAPVADLSDEFDAAMLGPQWTWVREPMPGGFGVSGGAFQFTTQVADLYVDSNDASVLHEEAPSGDYMVETRVTLDLPAEGCCFNFNQAGIIIYKDDDNYVKLASVSIWDTRQIEFAKELSPVPQDYPRYGASVVGTADKTLWLRVVKRTEGQEELYTAYSSRDGDVWVRGGTWAHNLGPVARIGLFAMGAGDPNAKFPASFDYVHVYNVKP
jgi:arabinan endo-1,5-alpha-L-arabinosidase